MNELEQVKERVKSLEGIISQLVFSDRYVVSRTLQLQDGRNVQLGKGAGTKMGTETTQKLGFFNATPVVRRSAISAPSSPGSSYAQAEAQSAVTAINSIRQALIDLGLTA